MCSERSRNDNSFNSDFFLHLRAKTENSRPAKVAKSASKES
jgi:hypothetical protein